jgi:hypothetical protein
MGTNEEARALTIPEPRQPRGDVVAILPVADRCIFLVGAEGHPNRIIE